MRPGCEDAAEELEELRRVVVAGEDDNRRELGELAQRVAGQLKIVDRRPRAVEEVAGVNRPGRARTRVRLQPSARDVSEIFAPLCMAVRAAEMPVGDVQEPH